MPARTLLYLTATKMVAYGWHAGQLVMEGAFDATTAGSEFVAYLGRRRSNLFSLLANVADEGFQVDSIPFLRARDRHAVLERKLGQFFLNAQLTTTVPLGYEKSRRKNERVLFAALTNKAMFEPWLAAIDSAEVRLEGIHSLPLVAARLMERLHAPRDRLLLLTAQDSSIRQTFFSRGHLQFSRISPLTNSSIVGLAQAIATETAKTQQYLLSQRLIARAEPLTVRVIAHPQAIPALETTCTGNETLRFEFTSLLDVAQKIGLKTPPSDSRADLVFLNTLAASPPAQQFAGAPLRKEYRLWQIGNGLRAAAAAVFVACAVLVAKSAFDLHQLGQQAAELRAAAASAEQRYHALAATFPPVPVSNDALRSITARYQEYARLLGGPAPLYAAISRALDAAPQVEIDAIDWTISEAPPKPPAQQETTESATIRGSLRMARNSNPRELLRTFEGFVAALKANGQLTVTIKQQPFDVGSEKLLKSSDSARDSDAPKIFDITVSRRIES